MPDTEVLTAADIARLAGVTRATVSNWRRRHADFPSPCGGTDASPAYDRAAVEAWLAARGALPELSLEDRLWRAIQAVAEKAGLGEATRLAGRFVEAGKLLPDSELERQLSEALDRQGRRATLDMLIRKYAETTGTKAFATPGPVADLMAALAISGEGGSVFDPAAGSGDLLTAARAHGASRVLGQELDATLAQLTRLRLAEDPAHATDVQTGDSLRDDEFPNGQFDAVVCHPPFGDRDWGADELADDPRWEYGSPPRSEPELAWIQHALAHLRPGQRAVVLLPPSVASRPAGRRIRLELVRRGALRAVVSLPPGAVYPRHIPTHIWVLQHPGEEPQTDPHVLMVDAAKLGDWRDLYEAVLGTWQSFDAGEAARSEEPGIWRVVPGIDLLDDQVDLMPARHIGDESRSRSPLQLTAEISDLRTRLRAALEKLAISEPREMWTGRERAHRWRTATVADLGRWEMLIFHRASATAPEESEAIDGEPVLTLTDVLTDKPPSAAVSRQVIKPEWIRIRADDVILPYGADDAIVARVATQQDNGAFLGRNLHLIRPDPERMDPWFLAGFLASPGNTQRASYGSISKRIDLRRLTVPVLPLDEQRTYAEEFRRMRDFEVSSTRIHRQVAELTKLLHRGLTEGALDPGPASGGSLMSVDNLNGANFRGVSCVTVVIRRSEGSERS